MALLPVPSILVGVFFEQIILLLELLSFLTSPINAAVNVLLNSSFLLLSIFPIEQLRRRDRLLHLLFDLGEHLLSLHFILLMLPFHFFLLEFLLLLVLQGLETFHQFEALVWRSCLRESSEVVGCQRLTTNELRRHQVVAT